MNDIKIDGHDYYLIAARDDFPWEHGVRVTVYDYENIFLGEARLACHPEFHNYEALQALNTIELINEAARLVSEYMASNRFQAAWESGLTPLLRLNQPNRC